MTSLVVLIAIIACFAAVIKLAARFLRGYVVTWKNCFLFSLLYLAINVTSRMTLKKFINIEIPPSIALALGFAGGFAMLLAVGGWFFRKRGADSKGHELGWRGGLKLMTVAYGIIGSFAIVAFGFIPRVL